MWKLLILIVYFSTTFDNTTANNRTSCLIRLRYIKALAPVILTSVSESDYKLFKPTGQITSIKAGTKLRLLCTGTNNAFANTGFGSMDLKCSKGRFEDNQNHIHNLNQLVCKDMPSSSLKLVTAMCGNDYGVIYNIGFAYNGQFYGPVYEICYNSKTERAIYAHATMNGAALDYSTTRTQHRHWKASGLQSLVKSSILNQQNQIQRFENYFGTKQNYIDKNNFLDFAQLAAEIDFVFGYEQQATLYYANAAPEFRAVNIGNWLRVEEVARTTAIISKDDIESYTGHMSTLKLPHQNGSQVKIYLDAANKFKVPKYFYKVLMRKAADSAIVLVTVNNPYIVDGPAEEFCPNVCEEAGIVNPKFRNTKEGYTFCCELNLFKQKVDSLTDEVRGSRLLKFATFH